MTLGSDSATEPQETNATRWKPSRYNLVVSKDERVFIANTLSRSSIALHGAMGQAVLGLLRPSSSNVDAGASPALQLLAENGFIVADEADEVAAAMARYTTVRRDTDMLGLVIAPTMSCNMGCYYCYEDKNDNHMSSDLADRICAFASEHLKDNGALEVKWHGGEPLQQVDFIRSLSLRLRQLAASRGCTYRAAMISNCYFLSEQVAETLANDCAVESIQVTFDGDRDSHDRIRRDKNARSESSFDRILGNVVAASEVIRIVVRVNVSPLNVASMPALLQRLSEAGLTGKCAELYFHPVFRYRPSLPGAPYAPRQNGNFTVREFAALETGFLELARGLGFKVGDFLTVPYASCAAVYDNSFVVDADGGLKKCYHDFGNASASFASLTDDTVANADNYDKWTAFTPVDDPQCKACELLPICYSSCPHKVFSKAPREEICPTLKYNWRERLPMVLEQV